MALGVLGGVGVRFAECKTCALGRFRQRSLGLHFQTTGLLLRTEKMMEDFLILLMVA